MMKRTRHGPNLRLQQSAAEKKFPMQTRSRWQPFRELDDDFQNRLSTLLGRPLRRTHGRRQEEPTLADWTPLAERGRLFPEALDKDDPWKFSNVLVT